MDRIQKYSDKEIIDGLKEGKSSREKSIITLYKEYFGLLSNFTLNNGGNVQDAEDIFQETILSFIELINNDKYRFEANIKTLLYTINRNLWYTELTKRNKSINRNKLFVAEHTVEDKNIDLYINERESRSELMEVITSLGNQCKEILLMYYYENMSMKEILDQTKFETEQVVRNKKYKCLKQLELMIKESPKLYEKLKNILNYVK